MALTDMTPKELREIIEYQESVLQFDHFTNEDALQLGLTIIETAKSKGLAPTINIVVNGIKVFKFMFDGTNLNNDVWTKAKINTMRATSHSTLHLVYKLAETGMDQKDLYMPFEEYAVSGGGFPIFLKGTGIIGYVCLSGLPHETDHRTLVDSMAKYLGVELEQYTPILTGY